MDPVHLRRDDSKIIIHFDLDCFYASVVENENPALKSVPLGIQQKQIIVTCNYEARRRGLYKLQLVTEAKKICPDAVIVLGEDLTRFRDASKENYNFLQGLIWSDRAERLGFDEIWIDCTDMVDYNYELLNHHDLEHSFFCMDKKDPTHGFPFDATCTFGPTFPSLALDASLLAEEDRVLRLRLILGSHLAQYLRHELESRRGYTSTVGIATNRILSKLVGNVNKPKNQTTLVPPYEDHEGHLSTVTLFMDGHDIGRLPGVGFKLAQKIRSHILGREAEFSFGLVYGGTKENVTVRDVRLYPGMGPETLEEILGGPGSPKGIGGRVWNLINGVDDNGVAKVKRVPSQISQEDSYMKYLHTFEQVRHQLFLLAERLIQRMHMDLMEDDDDNGTSNPRRWLAHPRTLRLSTRPRPPLGADGTRARTFHRITHSAPLPNFVFSLAETPSALADRLVEKNLITMFRKLHPERSGWNLSLINIAVTNMAETASDTKVSEGRDIGRMFRHQDTFLKDFRVVDNTSDDVGGFQNDQNGAETEEPTLREADHLVDDWQSEDESVSDTLTCHVCGHQVPIFAAGAHRTFHSLPG